MPHLTSPTALLPLSPLSRLLSKRSNWSRTEFRGVSQKYLWEVAVQLHENCRWRSYWRKMRMCLSIAPVHRSVQLALTMTSSPSAQTDRGVRSDPVYMRSKPRWIRLKRGDNLTRPNTNQGQSIARSEPTLSFPFQNWLTGGKTAPVRSAGINKNRTGIKPVNSLFRQNKYIYNKIISSCLFIYPVWISYFGSLLFFMSRFMDNFLIVADSLTRVINESREPKQLMHTVLWPEI